MVYGRRFVATLVDHIVATLGALLLKGPRDCFG